MRTLIVLDDNDVAKADRGRGITPRALELANDFLVNELLKAVGYTCIHNRRNSYHSYCDGCPLEYFRKERDGVEVPRFACLRVQSYPK